mmetsp:Transcript_28327/g.92497  ORF Transcript_28327/g.92497 Transcript_28327/m.92497 type:complete len:202 (+) Transcript_28327:50-655(+)
MARGCPNLRECRPPPPLDPHLYPVLHLSPSLSRPRPAALSPPLSGGGDAEGGCHVDRLARRGRGRLRLGRLRFGRKLHTLLQRLARDEVEGLRGLARVELLRALRRAVSDCVVRKLEHLSAAALFVFEGDGVVGDGGFVAFGQVGVLERELLLLRHVVLRLDLLPPPRLTVVVSLAPNLHPLLLESVFGLAAVELFAGGVG